MDCDSDLAAQLKLNGRRAMGGGRWALAGVRNGGVAAGAAAAARVRATLQVVGSVRER